MAQARLHRGEDLAVLPGLAVDHPVGMQPDPRQGGREQVTAVQAPEHRAAEPGEDAAGKHHMAKLDELSPPWRMRAIDQP